MNQECFSLPEKLKAHEAFWEGVGPGLILIPPGRQELYDLQNYIDRFGNPERMWAAEMERASRVIGQITDGIPTVRPNLGVIFVPAIAGQSYELAEGAMPWPGPPLGQEDIRAIRHMDIVHRPLMDLAARFYQFHGASGRKDVVAYHPDTQGVFDIAHLLAGDDILYDLADDSRADWITELMDICLDLYVNVTRHVKLLLNEEPHTMIHGHGTCQGVYFPHAGVRLSEDTAVLLSPAMIERVVLPTVRHTGELFGGIFVHFCGKHQGLLRLLCSQQEVKAIDLGNPESYDMHQVLELCAETGTVLYSRVPALSGESWQSYIRRLGLWVQETGARVILRPTVFPETLDECAAMRAMWQEATCL
jgi:hypothetical protein